MHGLPGTLAGSLLIGAAKAMVSLGDLPGAIDIDRVVLPGVSELTD